MPALNHVTCKGAEITTYLVADPTLPIHYVTFIGLRWRLRAVYSWASSMLSCFRPKIFCPVKTGPENGGFENGGLAICFWFQDPKRHILARNRVFWRILREDQCMGLGCSLWKTKKNEISWTWYVSPHMHEFSCIWEKNPGPIWSKFCTGEISGT